MFRKFSGDAHRAQGVIVPAVVSHINLRGQFNIQRFMDRNAPQKRDKLNSPSQRFLSNKKGNPFPDFP